MFKSFVRKIFYFQQCNEKGSYDVVPHHHDTAHPRVADGGDNPQVWRTSANIFNKQPIRGGLPAWGLGEGPTLHRKRKAH
jgi:hypothetical protein